MLLCLEPCIPPKSPFCPMEVGCKTHQWGQPEEFWIFPRPVMPVVPSSACKVRVKLEKGVKKLCNRVVRGLVRRPPPQEPVTP